MVELKIDSTTRESRAILEMANHEASVQVWDLDYDYDEFDTPAFRKQSKRLRTQVIYAMNGLLPMSIERVGGGYRHWLHMRLPLEPQYASLCVVQQAHDSPTPHIYTLTVIDKNGKTTVISGNSEMDPDEVAVLRQQ